MGKGKPFSRFQHLAYPPRAVYKLPDKRPTEAEIGREAFTKIERPRISSEAFKKIKGSLSKDSIDPRRWELTQCDIYIIRAKQDTVRCCSTVFTTEDIISTCIDFSYLPMVMLDGKTKQVYLAKEMKESGHCSNRFCDRDRIVNAFRKVQEKLAQQQVVVRLIEVDAEVGTSGRLFQDEYLTVRFNVARSIMERYNWVGIQKTVNAGGEEGEDGVRQNRRVDLGFTGHRNSKRCEDTYGLPHPEKHAHTMEPWSIMIFLAQTYLISQLFGSLGIYADADRAVYFSSLIHTRNVVEAIRIAITDKYHLLQFHWDMWNDGMDPRYAYVLVICCYLYHPDDPSLVQRVAVISYGKQAAYEFMAQLGILAVPLKAVKVYWENLPAEQKYISHEMLLSAKETEPKRMGWTHVCKNVFYACFVHCILELCRKYRKVASSLEMLCALVICSIASECPDHYWHGIQAILKDPTFLGEDYHIEETKGKKFGWRFWCYLHDRRAEHKDKITEDGKTKKNIRVLETIGPDWDYTTRQRHQPCVLRGEQADFDASVDTFMQCVVQMNFVLSGELARNIGHYFTTIVGIFCKRKRKGVFGAGPLTAQHLVVIAAFVGLFPDVFVDFAEIAIGTGSHLSLVRNYGFPRDPTEAVEVNRKFLAACSSLLDISFKNGEETICKHTSEGRYGDSIYPGASVPYLCEAHKDIRLLWPDGRVTIAPRLLQSVREELMGRKMDDWWSQKIDTKRIGRKSSSSLACGITNIWDYFPQTGLDRPIGSPKQPFSATAISGKMIHPGKRIGGIGCYYVGPMF